MDEQRHQYSPYYIRKVFFLYPHTIIKDIYKEIIYQGYDAFMVETHMSIVHFLKKCHHSILYINIDKVLKDEEWLAFTKKIIDFQARGSTDIGIMTDARLKKKHLAQKYLFEVGITCGFISLIPNPKKILEVIFKILDANEAKGRRKYVRAQCMIGDSFNFVHDDIIYYGDINDISLAGMSCMLHDQKLKLHPDMVLENIQLKLQGVISMVNGKVYGSRKTTDSKMVYLIIFEIDSIRQKGKDNIIDYICKRQADFIRQEADAYAETAPEFNDAIAVEESFKNKSDEQFVQEVSVDLHALNVELGEIDEILKDRSGNGLAHQ